MSEQPVSQPEKSITRGKVTIRNPELLKALKQQNENIPVTIEEPLAEKASSPTEEAIDAIPHSATDVQHATHGYFINGSELAKENSQLIPDDEFYSILSQYKEISIQPRDFSIQFPDIRIATDLQNQELLRELCANDPKAYSLAQEGIHIMDQYIRSDTLVDTFNDHDERSAWRRKIAEVHGSAVRQRVDRQKMRKTSIIKIYQAMENLSVVLETCGRTELAQQFSINSGMIRDILEGKNQIMYEEKDLTGRLEAIHQVDQRIITALTTLFPKVEKKDIVISSYTPPEEIK